MFQNLMNYSTNFLDHHHLTNMLLQTYQLEKEQGHGLSSLCQDAEVMKSAYSQCEVNKLYETASSTVCQASGTQ